MPDDHVGLAVAVQVAGRDGDAALERRAERVQRLEQAVRLRVVDLHLRRAARARADDQVGSPVTVDVAERDRDAGLASASGVRRERPAGLAVQDLDGRRPWPAAMSATPSWLTSPSASETGPV